MNHQIRWDFFLGSMIFVKTKNEDENENGKLIRNTRKEGTRIKGKENEENKPSRFIKL